MYDICGIVHHHVVMLAMEEDYGLVSSALVTEKFSEFLMKSEVPFVEYNEFDAWTFQFFRPVINMYAISLTEL